MDRVQLPSEVAKWSKSPQGHDLRSDYIRPPDDTRIPGKAT
jgi:hypothetical protein